MCHITCELLVSADHLRTSAAMHCIFWVSSQHRVHIFVDTLRVGARKICTERASPLRESSDEENPSSNESGQNQPIRLNRHVGMKSNLGSDAPIRRIYTHRGLITEKSEVKSDSAKLSSNVHGEHGPGVPREDLGFLK